MKSKVVKIRKPPDDSRKHFRFGNTQKQILRGICDGLKDPEIAMRLGISKHTLHSRMRTLLNQLKARTRAQAVFYFMLHQGMDYGALTKQSCTRLTMRQKQVVREIQGANDDDLIASHLGVSINTVKFHIRNLMKLFRATSRAQIVWKYMRSEGYRNFRVN